MNMYASKSTKFSGKAIFNDFLNIIIFFDTVEKIYYSLILNYFKICNLIR